MTKEQIGASLTTRIGKVVENVGRILADMGKLEIRLGREIDAARTIFSEAKAADVLPALEKVTGTTDWRQYARELVPGRSVATLYRWCNAGAVAKVLGNVGNADVGSLVPLYRILTDSADGTKEEQAAAVALVKEAWSEAVKAAPEGKPPKEADVLEIANRIAPSTKGKAAEEKGTEEAASTTEGTTPEGTTEGTEGTEGTTPEGTEGETVVVLEAAKVEAAAGPVASMRKQWTTDLVGKPLTEEGVVAIMLGTARLCAAHGAAVAAVVQGTTAK